MAMIAACGLTCTTCPAFVATKTGDRALQEKTAAEWSKMGGKEIKPEDLLCDGCQSEGSQLYSYCNTCEVRACVHGKGYTTCAECAGYDGCTTIGEFLKTCPDAKEVLDGLRAK